MTDLDQLPASDQAKEVARRLIDAVGTEPDEVCEWLGRILATWTDPDGFLHFDTTEFSVYLQLSRFDEPLVTANRTNRIGPDGAVKLLPVLYQMLTEDTDE